MISAVMCTYGRFKCVERALNCFISQTYSDKKEIIIYNTDIENPYKSYMSDIPRTVIGDIGNNTSIRFINNNTDYITGKPYTNVGAIRRDALTHARGNYVVTWDDDDIFLPFFLEQAMDRMKETNLPSFKPAFSFFADKRGIHLVQNTMEASVVADINLVRKYGYLLETGSEGLGWYTKMRDTKKLDENDPYYIPSYCFNWSDGEEMSAAHKQSGDINNPNNFSNHKNASKDPAIGPLYVWDKERLDKLFAPYYKFILEKDFPQELKDKYVTR